MSFRTAGDIYKLLIGAQAVEHTYCLLTLALVLGQRCDFRIAPRRAQPTAQQHSAAKRMIGGNIQLSLIHCEYIRMGKAFAVPYRNRELERHVSRPIFQSQLKALKSC